MRGDDDGDDDGDEDDARERFLDEGTRDARWMVDAGDVDAGSEIRAFTTRVWVP